MSHQIVLIAGGTASGKTTLAREVVRRMGGRLVAHDRYYRTVEDPEHHNYDHPDALETELLVTHLHAMAEGRGVDLPRYRYDLHARAAEFEHVEPSSLIVVEGILVLHDPTLRALADLCVYVDAAADIRLGRRMLRDIVERHRAPAEVLQQYFESVRPSHDAFVEPSKQHADVVISGESSPEAMVEAAMVAIREGLAER